MKNLTILAILIAALFLMTGCGGGDDTTAEADNPTADAAESVNDAAEAVEDAADEVQEAAEDLEEAATLHDCAGGCGMTGVSEAKMTEIDGKWYCAGCAAKAEEDSHEGHGHG